VTGGTSGIGAAVAQRLAAEGASVYAMGRDPRRGAAVEQRARSAAGNVRFVAGDVRDGSAVSAAVSACREETGRLDFVFHGAGVLGAPGALHELSAEDWRTALDANLIATVIVCREAVVGMLESGGGSIVTCGSILSLAADSAITVYTVTKSAVLGLSRAIALAYAKNNIRCNCICPGDVDTPMVQQFLAAADDPTKARARLDATYPAGRIAQPDEVAAAAAFLLSDDARYVTGTSLLVDGGLSADAY
jgi:NAD(P)-dependent dehydrogenase (short-subunit alcohol dehydrogenase family)